ncbi:P-loop containing nucleoside triphosphate hydrolase protein [Vararia minispora EC-137]|uniref:P-loop containing nucleoside triphosphate hydrolase protein n=1 Tax=Vararia minispora EC-137 TaxID=1314806 RepID=A0ACB8QLD9_9AGAM|nr:P-loop containing nucleoside triphosphate hydrolase protein [Vararia minispora EC-137]
MNTRSGGAATTRASSRLNRSTNQTEQPAAPVRTTRAASGLRLAEAAAKKTTTRAPVARQPLANHNTAEAKSAPAKKAQTKATTVKVAKATSTVLEGDREPIKVRVVVTAVDDVQLLRQNAQAFLRIRPNLSDGEPSVAPYIEHLSDASVRMVDPTQDNNPTLAPYPRFRPSAAPASAVYTFSHVFPPATQQSEFFTKTTLPLVNGLLNGENGLLFAYGVTNSGKTFTMQGGNNRSSAGILPRTLDVIFNSIDGLQSTSKVPVSFTQSWQYRPVRLHGIELEDSPLPLDVAGIFSRGPSLAHIHSPIESEPVMAEVLAEHLKPSSLDVDADPTVLKVDRNYEYSIWLSYAEVYNEKIYDLLADVDGSTGNNNATMSQRILLTRKALSIRPSPPSDSPDSTTGGKYVAGLRQIRVNSAIEAKNLVKLGQLHRRVFGTLANSQSSRSHGVVTMRLLKKHRGEKDEPASYVSARLTLIDLAGSERTKHTQTTGDRLKEAGNINKSLMVLGQCMEVMRANQRRIAQALGGPKGERADTRDVRKNLAVVPFRHSKLTEILMDYFVGDGRTVMIVNVNPYDTGFDENSHVMKFAALAKEVHTPAPIQHPFPRIASPTKVSGIPQAPRHRQVTLSTGGREGRKFSETQVEVFEEDEDEGDASDSDSEAPPNPLIEALFDEIDSLRLQLFEAEERAALIEAETREEITREMSARMQEMEKMYAKRLVKEVEQQEEKADAKIDMLHRAGVFGRTPGKMRVDEEEDEDEEEMDDVEQSIVKDEDANDDDESHVPSRSSSPLANKGRGKSRISEIRIAVPSGPAHCVLPTDESEAETATATETETEPDSQVDEDEETDEDDGDYREESDESDEYEPEPPVQPTPKAKKRPSPALNRFNPSATRGLPPLEQAPSPIFERDVRGSFGAGERESFGKNTKKPSSKISALASDLNALRIASSSKDGSEEWDMSEDDSMVLPSKKAAKKAGPAKRKKYVSSSSGYGCRR